MAVTANTVGFWQNYGEFVKSHLTKKVRKPFGEFVNSRLIKKSFSSALFSFIVINLPNWKIWIE